MTTLHKRIISGVLLGLTVIGLANFGPAVLIWAFISLFVVIGQREFYTLAEKAGIPSFKVVGVIFGVLLTAASFFPRISYSNKIESAYLYEHLVMGMALIVIFIRQFPQKNNDRPIETVGCTLLGIWYVPYLFSFIVRLVLSGDVTGLTDTLDSTGLLTVLYMIVVVKCTDMGAFFVGRKLGKHKLFPRLSPGKTWEGFAGGVVAALIASVVFIAVTGGELGSFTMSYTDAVLLGLLLSVSGVVGDMFESLVKRAAQSKDSGALIPGMGGLLDVLDSLLFGAPIMYFYIMLVVAR